MEFWGVEVKAGQPLKVSPGEGKVIHLSQAAIGESKKGKDESVPVHVKVGEQKLVIGTLSADKFPQIQYDVVFDKDFELSHNGKNGSVFFCGYKTQNPEEDDEIYSGDDFDSDSEDEELPIENGKPEPVKAVGASKPVSAVKPKAKKDEVAKVETADSDEDSSDEDGLSDSDDEDLSDDDDKMDSDDSEEEDEKTPTPKKDNKKRPTEPASKTPVPSKKVKLATPQKTDGKKAAAPHTATPHPAKQSAKAPKSENPKTPASAGKATCNSCSKTFNSEKALESHSKAKHATAK